MSRKKKPDVWDENGFEDWGGYMAAKQAKLEEQFHIEANNEVKTSSIFQGIAIFVNGYTTPTADELRRLMMTHGGTYHHYMRPKITTHIIASNLPYTKIMLYRKSQNPIPICKPEWIVDSIKAGRILNFQNYLLYSQCTDVQPQLKYIVKDKKQDTNDIVQLHNNSQKSNTLNILNNNSEGTDETSKQASVTLSDSHPVVSINSKGAQSTKNSEFISEFYSHSRLHHIATMGATFKDYVNELRDTSSGNFPGLIKLKELKNMKLNRVMSDSQIDFDSQTANLQEDNQIDVRQNAVIMHIDMDCFFVSVGLRNKPQFRGLPVAVTHAKGNKKPGNNNNQILDNNINKDDEHGSLSEVASCSYEARKAGVKNGMFLGDALKVCPTLKTIPYDFEGYTEVSYMLYDTVASYTLDIEAVSCDEMYADCTKILKEYSLTPMEFASVIRKEIKNKTGCPVSTGFGSNKLLARLATKKAKPNGQFCIQQEHIRDHISSFKVQDLPGVGWTTAHKLNNINIRTCAELEATSLTILQKEFGKKTGEMLYNMCRGIDNSKLNLEHVRKSVSAEVNYGIRFENNDDAIDFLKKLSCEVCNRLNKANAKGRCITLKLLIRAKEAPKETEKFMGHGLCDYVTKSKNLIAPINDADIVTKEVLTLWNQIQKQPEDARGIGIQISRLEILKTKSRDTTLMSFIKNKQPNTFYRSTDVNINESAPVANTSPVALIPENVVVTSEQRLHIAPDYDKPINSESAENLRNNDLSVVENKQVMQNIKDQEAVIARKADEKKSRRDVQTLHEHFFKQTKSGISRPTKVEMPPIQEIDMSVLIELPEDIRNEILNEYSNKRDKEQININTNQNSTLISPTRATNSAETNCGEQDISFSQVDPEFLAALPDDLKRDVQVYCSAKKAEHCVKTRKEDVSRNSRLIKGDNIKQSKKIEHNSKIKNCKNSKTTIKVRRKNVQTALKSTKITTNTGIASDSKANNGVEKLISYTERTKSVNRQIVADETEAILSHERTILENKDGTAQQQDSLIDLVNHLLNLPLKQVKMQIQMWITNSKIENEVDFLSLTTFLSMLPEKKRIEDLHVLLKTMHRCMTKTGNCIWHRTYRKTVKYVQHYMQIEYNSNLMVPSVKCNLLRCNSDVM